MTSSLRNSIHRRNHKERSQLAHRSKLGILEKHADYVKRARDYHSKQDRLRRLKQKAAERNKDEFYFSMVKEKSKGGVHIKDRGNIALPTDIVKVLKTQDENYVRTMRAAGLKKIDKLKSQLMALANLVKPSSLGRGSNEEKVDELNEEDLQVLKDAGIISGGLSGKEKGRGKPKHIIFVDNDAEGRKYQSQKDSPIVEQVDVEMAAEGDEVGLGWKVAEDKKKQKKQMVGVDGRHDYEVPSNEIPGNRPRLLKELAARLARDKQLRYAEREFEMQRLLMGKGARKKLRGVEKVEGDNKEDKEDEDEVDARKGKRRHFVGKVDEQTYKPRVYKWRLERKR